MDKTVPGTMHPQAHWNPHADFSALPFFIRRMDTSGYVKVSDVPEARLPLIGFIYIVNGEVLDEVDGASFLCQPGQILLIPQNTPFSVRYYRNVVGYSGGFAPSMLSDTKALKFLSSPFHQGFWFDEGAFMGELFNMLAISFDKGDRVFIEKGLDLLLTRVKPGKEAALPVAVCRFLESVFDPIKTIGTISSYAAENRISGNYLSRLVKNATGRSVGAWIGIARIHRAKRLLSGTRMPVIDVAAAVGFEDQSYFSRLFKKETGMTPLAFRKQMQG